MLDYNYSAGNFNHLRMQLTQNNPIHMLSSSDWSSCPIIAVTLIQSIRPFWLKELVSASQVANHIAATKVMKYHKTLVVFMILNKLSSWCSFHMSRRFTGLLPFKKMLMPGRHCLSMKLWNLAQDESLQLCESPGCSITDTQNCTYMKRKPTIFIPHYYIWQWLTSGLLVVWGPLPFWLRSRIVSVLFS